MAAKAKQEGKALLTLARKQFIKEATKWLKDNIDHYGNSVYPMDDEFYSDFKKALK